MKKNCVVLFCITALCSAMELSDLKTIRKKMELVTHIKDLLDAPCSSCGSDEEKLVCNECRGCKFRHALERRLYKEKQLLKELTNQE